MDRRGDFCIVRDLRRIAGEEAADKFVRAFGGTRIYIPKKIAPDHPISRAIGFEAARALADNIGPYGASFTVRLLPLQFFEKQRTAIRQLLAGGASASQIARQVGCHIRTVYRERALIRKQGMPS